MPVLPIALQGRIRFHHLGDEKVQLFLGEILDIGQCLFGIGLAREIHEDVLADDLLEVGDHAVGCIQETPLYREDAKFARKNYFSPNSGLIFYKRAGLRNFSLSSRLRGERSVCSFVFGDFDLELIGLVGHPKMDMVGMAVHPFHAKFRHFLYDPVDKEIQLFLGEELHLVGGLFRRLQRAEILVHIILNEFLKLFHGVFGKAQIQLLKMLSLRGVARESRDVYDEATPV